MLFFVFWMGFVCLFHHLFHDMAFQGSTTKLAVQPLGWLCQLGSLGCTWEKNQLNLAQTVSTHKKPRACFRHWTTVNTAQHSLTEVHKVSPTITLNCCQESFQTVVKGGRILTDHVSLPEQRKIENRVENSGRANSQNSRGWKPKR